MIKRGLILATIVVAALGYAGAAAAGTPDGPGPWADYVVAHNQGCAYNPPDMVTCVPVPAARQDPTAALGVAESPAGPNPSPPPGSFYSLGFTDPSRGTAFITLGFDNPICNAPGADLSIQLFEITQEPYPNETVQVYVSADGTNFVFAGTVTKDGTVGMPASVPVANFVKIVDATNKLDFIATPIIADGYDLDGVKALSTTQCPGGTGFIEVCKSLANGMSGRSFEFSVAGGTPFSVKGGRCSGPIQVPSGAVRVTEAQSNPPTDVASVQVRSSNRLLFQDLANRTVVVKVVPSTSAGTETQVIFTNEPAGGLFGSLKICKISESPSFWGVPFSFSVNGGPLVSTIANSALDDPANWSCRIVGTFLINSKVSVREAIPANTDLFFFDTDPPSALLDFDTDAGTALVQISAPVTTLLVDDEPVALSQTGYLEVCKDRATVNGVPDPFVTGAFQFTVTDGDGNTFNVTTFAGQCTASFQVAAGIVTVTEAPALNQTLVGTDVIPADRFVDENPINRSIDVEVPVSSNMNDETQVHFVNRHDRGQVKVCKLLGPSSGALDGQFFNFTVTSPGMPDAHPSVQASTTTNQCTVVGDYPVGSTVTVTEDLNHGPGQPGQYIDTTGEGTFPVGSGVNNINITNTAVGVIEICKKAVPGINVQPTFHFRIDNVTLVNVRAGTCDQGKRVAPGVHTVSEIAEQFYELDPFVLGGPIQVGSNGSPSTVDTSTRTATVTVPYAGTGGEVVVTFWNRIKRAQLKVCKQVALGSLDQLDGKTFPFIVYLQNGGTHAAPTFATINVSVTFDKNNPLDSCTLPVPVGSYPILQPNGEKTIAAVQETPPVAGTVVTSITVSPNNGMCVLGPGTPGGNDSPNCVTGGVDLPTREIDWFLSPTSVNQVTYTNMVG